jgi:hypothetical protein
MGARSRGRGAAAAFGLLLLVVGIVGAIVLWMMAERRPDQAIEGFARGPVGCTTTLEFGDTGTFYVYAETVASDSDSDAFAACDPVPSVDTEFAVELRRDGRALAPRSDDSITYDIEDAIGESLARYEIAERGRYELAVEGGDAAVVAAVGRDPNQGVDDLRRGAIVVGAVGIVLGALMLLLAGRRSKRAATFTAPDGPGWAPTAPPGRTTVWPPEPPRVPQLPVNPHLPPEPVVTVPPAPPARPADADRGPGPAPWAPPAPGERRDPPPPA